MTAVSGNFLAQDPIRTSGLKTIVNLVRLGHEERPLARTFASRARRDSNPQPSDP
jgi:hypothetical protein